MIPAAPERQAIAGFESSAYAYVHGQIAWVGGNAAIEHPRNAARPWQPAPFLGDAASLSAGAHICLRLIDAAPPKGLLLWLIGHPLPPPMHLAGARFDAIRTALEDNNIKAFEAAALRVIGLGLGLTPSGDDFVGSILFALAHAPRADWLPHMPALSRNIRTAASTRTNAISAALLDDLIQGASYGALHEMLNALQSRARPRIKLAMQNLMGLGASSGADMLAGLLLTLTTMPAVMIDEMKDCCTT